MKPKKGDMTFENNWQYTSFVRWNVDVDGCDFSNIKLATPEHLASMGLVTQAEYDALQTRYLDLVTEVEKLREFAYEQEDKKPEPAKEPQPTHRFKVGDKVKIVRSTPWRSGKSGEHTECVGCTGTLKQPSMRIIDFDVELDEKHDGLLTAGCMSADLELIKAAPQPVIEFGDIVRVVSISDSRFGIRQDAYNIGLVGVWGKCTQAGWDGCINDLDCFMYDDLELVSKAPEPHVWSVGDYALCPDGKVRRVKEVSIQDLSFHDSTWEPKKDCTPCPEPEMPRWRGFDGCMEFFLRPDGNLMSSDYKYDAPIPKWLDFLPDKYQSTKKYLIALRDWRALTGRMV